MNRPVMFHTVFLQIMVTLLATIAAGLLAGTHGAVSAAMGGLLYALPNLLFATHLKLVQCHFGQSFALHYLAGEFVKLLMTFSLLACVIRFYPGLHWPALLCGLVLASQAVLLSFWKKN